MTCQLRGYWVIQPRRRMSTSTLAICSVIERRPVGDNVSLVCALTAVIRLVIRKSFDRPLSAASTKWCSRPEADL